MSFQYQSERKDFVRIHAAIPVRYKFLSREIDLGSENVFEGTTTDLSGSGLLLVGKLPKLEWIPPLLMGQILIGVNLILPSCDYPLKGLAQVAWMEAFREGSDKWAMGLQFREIAKDAQDEIFRYVIKVQITKTR
jgi:c-di-GMP-binding flagellar brake protein YcgR